MCDLSAEEQQVPLQPNLRPQGGRGTEGDLRATGEQEGAGSALDLGSLVLILEACGLTLCCPFSPLPGQRVKSGGAVDAAGARAHLSARD